MTSKNAWIRWGFGVAAATAMVATPLTAFATPAENGGNGEGQLAVYASYPLASPTTSLQLGQTYYIELLNAGGQANLTSIKSAPNNVTFNFINPSVKLQGDPGHWAFTTTFSVSGTLQGGTSPSDQPYVYKITLPRTAVNGDYTIEAGPVQMNPNIGEDEWYFSNDPSIGGTGSKVYGYNLSGQLPEVPYAGVLPIFALLGAGYFVLRRRRNQSL